MKKFALIALCMLMIFAAGCRPAESSTPEPTDSSAPVVIPTPPVDPNASAPSTPSDPSSGTVSDVTPSDPAPTGDGFVLPTTFDPNASIDTGFSQISASKATNSDVRGWLTVPNTNISYPVLYYPDNNDYYLNLNILKQYDKNGVIYADYETKFGSASEISKNTVLYGHNWTNISANPRIGEETDVMFAQLAAFHHLNFAQVTPYIYYSTEAEEMVWQVFAAFYTDVGFYYIRENPNATQFADLVNGAKARSRHIYDVDVDADDKVLTLSTCTRAYGSSENQRFVIMARLMEPGEELTAVNITANPNPVLPNL